MAKAKPIAPFARGIRVYRRIVAIVTVAAGLVVLTTASGHPADEPSPARFGQVNDYVDAYVEANHIPGVAAAVIGPDGVQQRVFARRGR